MPYGYRETRFKRTGYSSYIDRYAKMGRAQRRIEMPQIPRRPLRFQLRTLLRGEAIKGQDPWWLTVHRRGIRRQKVGMDALEARAVPASLVPGYLTERILYATLVNLFHFVPGVDFLFQSSIEGGRLEMGGLVADFLFPILRIVLNPLGPHHYQFRNMAKDEEQVAILKEMGYDVYLIDDDIVYDEIELENFLRRVFGWTGSGRADSGGHPAHFGSTIEEDEEDYRELYEAAVRLDQTIRSSFAA